MLHRKKKSKAVTETSSQIERVELKYPKPKILLIDIKDNSKKLLLSEGYNVSESSFGAPYKVRIEDNFQPVIANDTISDCSEQEIVIIDLVPKETLKEPEGEKVISEGEYDWWASSSRGIIDPRPRTMASLQNEFDRILSYGGVFVIFSAPKRDQKLVFARADYRGLEKKSDIPYNNWSFLSILHKERIRVSVDRGEEIKSGDWRYFDELISEFAPGSYFNCTFSHICLSKEKWVTLAKNKFGDAVAILMAIDSDHGKEAGHILIFPQIQNKADFLLKLMKDTLPRLAPHLFPHIENTKWIH